MMQAGVKIERKRKQQVLNLVCRIRRLKNKLISYGMTGKQSIDVILHEFLKAPQIDWTLPHNTAIFYQIQNKYHTDHNTAELILILNTIVPNWQARSVVQYLHQTLSYNALSFGIDLQISDESSNQDGNDMTMLLIKAKKKNSQFGLKPKKRNHLSGSANNTLFYNSAKNFQHSDQQLRKRIHYNQKIEELKPYRKQTQGEFEQGPRQLSQHSVFPSMNEDISLKSNQLGQYEQFFQMKKQKSEQADEKGKRPYPAEIEYLQEQKLEKKVKK